MSEQPSGALEPAYDEFYFTEYEGGTYERSDQWIGFFSGIADEIVDRLAPDSVLDAGCAIGLLVEELHNRGVDAHGIDISEWAIEQVPEGLADRCHLGSLADLLPNRYDLIVSIEVIEHIPEDDLQLALDNMCGATDRLLISTTPYHFDDPTHINIKQPERWSAELARRGFVRDIGFNASFITPWAALYVRTSKAWPQVVEDYDRQYWYDRREILTTRSGIIELQDQVRHLHAERDADTSGQAVADLKERDVEILRLRDELRGVLAEKGSAVGESERLRQELGSKSAALLEAAERLADTDAQLRVVTTSRTWKAGRLVTIPLRLLRGRE